MQYSKSEYLLEITKNIFGYYTPTETLKKIIKWNHFIYWTLLIISFLSIGIFFTFENKYSIIDIWRKNLETTIKQQSELQLFAIKYILSQALLISLIFLSISLLVTIRSTITLYIQGNKNNFLFLIKYLTIPLSKYSLQSLGELTSKERKINLLEEANKILEKQKFPEFSKEKNMVKISKLTFMYHSDNEWDKYLHLFLKKFFPSIYKKHLLNMNTVSKHEEHSNKEPTALKNINLEIKRNKFTTIMGCNGSSKTTLIKTIINLFEKYSGDILWLNKNLKNISLKSFYRNVAYIDQRNIIYNKVTVYDYVACGLFPSFSLFKFNYSKNDPTILKNLELLGLLKYKDKNIHDLSGGERQKVILARALTQKTNVIVLDEPTTYLDISNQYLILNTLKKIQVENGKTIIAILHDLDQTRQFSDEVIFIKEGEIACQGEVNEVMSEENIKRVFNLS